MNLKSSLPLIAATCLVASTSSAQTVFSEDFSGTKNWNFNSIVDPANQIGGTGEFNYTFGPTNSKSYLTEAFTLAGATTAETGTFTLSGSFDLSGITFGTSDFYKRNLITIQTSSGNKSSFDSTGALINIGLSGGNNPGDYSFGQSLAIRFGNGGINQIFGFQPAGDFTFDFVSTITISGDDANGWTVAASTDLTNDNGTLNMSSSYSRVDTGFNGLQSISGIQVGLSPDTTPVANSPEALGTRVMVLDNLSLSVAAVPEPGTVSLLVVAGLGGIALLRRRRA